MKNGGNRRFATVENHDCGKLWQLRSWDIKKSANAVSDHSKTAENLLPQLEFWTGANWGKLGQAKAVAPVVYISPYYIGGIYNHNWGSLRAVAWTGASHGRS